MQNQPSQARNNGLNSQENAESEAEIDADCSDGQIMTGSKRTFRQMRRSASGPQNEESLGSGEQQKNGWCKCSPMTDKKLSPFLLDRQHGVFDSTSVKIAQLPFEPIEEEKDVGPRAATPLNRTIQSEEEPIPAQAPSAAISISIDEKVNVQKENTVVIKSGGQSLDSIPHMTMINTCEVKKDESRNNSKENSEEWNQESSSKILIQIHKQVTPPQVIYDKNIINDYKTAKMQVLFNCIEEQGSLPRQDCFLNTMKIVREFKAVGMQMLIFRHKLPDVQNNTLLLKSILGFKPETETETSFQRDSLQNMIPELKKKIPVFLLVLTALFSIEELRIFLEDCNQMGQTALHYAARNNLEDVVEFLIKDCQVNVSLVNKMGNTPLHIAVLNNRALIASMLVSAKVDVLIENKEGYNCLQHSQRMELIEMCEYLDPIVIHAEIWQQKNCLVKLLVSKEGTKFQHISEGVFREIIKYA